MRKMSFAAAVLSLFTVALHGETLVLDNPAVWGNPPKMKSENASLLITGPGQYITTQKYPLDPAATYQLSAEIRLGKDSPAAPFIMGFILYDKDDKVIEAREVNTFPGSDTVLSAPVKAGDTQLRIRNGARWAAADKGFSVPAFQTDPSGKDLPNRTAEADTTGIEEVKRAGTEWLVTLKKPLKADYPAETGVRLHVNGGFFYSSVTTPSTEWKEAVGKVKGINPKVISNQWMPGKFWTGAASFRIMIMPNWNWGIKNSVVEVKNLKLEITRQSK